MSVLSRNCLASLLGCFNITMTQLGTTIIGNARCRFVGLWRGTGKGKWGWPRGTKKGALVRSWHASHALHSIFQHNSIQPPQCLTPNPLFTHTCWPAIVNVDTVCPIKPVMSCYNASRMASATTAGPRAAPRAGPRPHNAGAQTRGRTHSTPQPWSGGTFLTTKLDGGRAHVRSFATSSSSSPPPPPPQQQQRQQMQEDPFATKEHYSDADPLSKFMIRYFSAVMSKQLGGKPYDGTYEGFVELSREIMRGRTTKEQQDTVASVLSGLLPPQSPERFRKWFPLNKRNAEFNAWITTLGFTWLVGPSELTEVQVQFQGKQETWRSGVHIKKCRYLENSGCVGMCTNMCKIPTQRFFTDMFGLPLTMNPNFETLECEMIFGQEPKPLEEDEVYNQPCLRVCNISSKTASAFSSEKPCPKIDTERSL